MRAKLATIALALVATLLAPACGGGDSGGDGSASDQSKAEAVAADLKSSVASGDFSKACKLYTAEAQAELESRAKGAVHDCPAALTRLFRSVPEAAKKKLQEIKITSTVVSGGHATATDTAGGTTYLTKIGDTWLVDKTPKGSG
jgi:hypothetical protein